MAEQSIFCREARKKQPSLAPTDRPNAVTYAALREVQKMKENPKQGKTYTNTEKMMEDLLQ